MNPTVCSGIDPSSPQYITASLFHNTSRNGHKVRVAHSTTNLLISTSTQSIDYNSQQSASSTSTQKALHYSHEVLRPFYHNSLLVRHTEVRSNNLNNLCYLVSVHKLWEVTKQDATSVGIRQDAREGAPRQRQRGIRTIL